MCTIINKNVHIMYKKGEKIMKYCQKCGNEVNDEAVVCLKCGCEIKKDKETNQSNESSKASMILGILGIIFAWFFALVGHILSIIGIVYGVKEYKQNEKIAGLTLSIIGEVCAVLSSVLGVLLTAGL